MIQLLRDLDNLITNPLYLNLKNYVSSDFNTSNGFLINLKSQLTNRDYTFIPTAIISDAYYNDRFVALFILYVRLELFLYYILNYCFFL